MNLEEFEEIVDETLVKLPQEYRQAMENVGILVEEWPTWEDYRAAKAHPRSLLFGLYSGIPKTKRLSGYSALPDKIKIFAGPILLVSKNTEEAKEQIKKTVLHEIGHHFGLSDQEIYSAQGY